MAFNKQLLVVVLLFLYVSFVSARKLLRQCDNPKVYSGTSCSMDDCKSCLGSTSCCSDYFSPSYGLCTDSSADQCPDGGKFVCNGGNCPKEISCNYVHPQNDKNKAWGTISCVNGVCPDGYFQGMFCHQDGSSSNFKVCCSIIHAEIPVPSPPPPQKPVAKPNTYIWCDKSNSLPMGPNNIVFESFEPYVASGWVKLFQANMNIKQSEEYNALYQKECASNYMMFNVPVNSGCYNVTIYNAEIYFVCYDGEDKRLFNIEVQDKHIETNLDLYKAAGAVKAYQSQQFVLIEQDDANVSIEIIAVKDLGKMAGLSVTLVDKEFCP